MPKFHIENKNSSPFTLTLSGRVAWALEALISAGDAGVTPIDNPAPRWAACIHRLRAKGVSIEILRECHDGQFSGHHARYLLSGRVTRQRNA